MALDPITLSLISQGIGGGLKFFGAHKAQKDAERRANSFADQIPGLRRRLNSLQFGVDQSQFDVAEQGGILAEEATQQAIEQAQRQESQIASGIRTGDARMAAGLAKTIGDLQRKTNIIATEGAREKVGYDSALSREVQRVKDANKSKDIRLSELDLRRSEAGFDAQQYAADANFQAKLDAIGATASGLGSSLMMSGINAQSPKDSGLNADSVGMDFGSAATDIINKGVEGSSSEAMGSLGASGSKQINAEQVRRALEVLGIMYQHGE
ncbi:MAG: hypothetical protein HRT61_00430 [Ekhidna sp.]|nr:hypothetical protein [Ekhidna sp.]